MFLICLVFTGYNPRLFFWVPLAPLLFIVWVLRVRTCVDASGIHSVYLFRRTAHLPWEDFAAIRFSRSGRAYARARSSAEAGTTPPALSPDADGSRSAGSSGTGPVAQPEPHSGIPASGSAHSFSSPESRARAARGAQGRAADASGRGAQADAASPAGRLQWLPGVTFNSLTQLSEASGGRIPDPVTPAREDAARKVQVVNKRGQAVLMNPEEYAEYQAQREAEEAQRAAEASLPRRDATQPQRAADGADA